MKKNEFLNVINSLKTLFPDDKRDKEVFIQEYYPALKNYEVQVVSKSINALSARITNFQKLIWPLDVIESEVYKHSAKQHYPVVKWRKKMSDEWNYDNCELEKARGLEKRYPGLIEVLYDTLPLEMRSQYDDPDDPVASDETVDKYTKEIMEILKNSPSHIAKQLVKSIKNGDQPIENEEKLPF